MATKLKELGELAQFMAQIMTSIDAKLSDNKLSLTEGISLTLEILPTVSAAFAGIKNIPAELSTATIDDLNQLSASVATNLSFRNEKNEQIAIKAVNMAIYAADLIFTLRNKPTIVPGFGSAGLLVIQQPMSIDDEKDVIL